MEQKRKNRTSTGSRRRKTGHHQGAKLKQQEITREKKRQSRASPGSRKGGGIGVNG